MTTINLNRKEFIKVLNIGGSLAGHSKTMPILDCVKIKIGNGFITVVSTDIENAISKKMPIQEKDLQITFCVNYKDISSYIKLIADDIVTFVINEADIEIKHEKGSITLPLSNKDDFPIIKIEDSTVNFSIDSATINNWIVDARGFLDINGYRQVLTGIYFYYKDGKFGCCSTNSRILFTDNVDMSFDTEFDFVLNKNVLKTVCDVCAVNDTVEFRIGDKNVAIIGENVSVSARLLNERYPNFSAIMPQNSAINVKADKQQLINAINRLKVGASQGTKMIKMSVSGTNMEITCDNILLNKKVVENIAAETNNEIIIGFDADNILLAISAIATENIVFNFTDSTRATLVNEDDPDSNKNILVMPVLLGEQQ